LYDDQTFTRFELELLHTPILQRLYNLKQLGFTDRIYPDAIHSRFNHILGATEVAERMGQKLIAWLTLHKGQEFAYFDIKSQGETKITAGDIATQLKDRVPALRLMAVLHDLTHAAFGHTLEDEVNVFDEKHDDPRRQRRFFDALVAQLLYLWCTEQRLQRFEATVLEELSELTLSSGHKREIGWAEELQQYLRDDKGQLAALAEHMQNLELAFQLLLHLDFAHNADDSPQEHLGELLASKALEAVGGPPSRRDFVLHRDMFLLDLVGNTICADLLDYARRDADNAGLKIQFDDRFLRYLCITSVNDDLSPDRKRCIRTAIQIFTDKMRYDVLSEMSGILKARYLINERVLFHPTKCAAGAMLGTAVQLLGLRDLPDWMQVLGDQEFLRALMVIARNLEASVPAMGAPWPAKPQPWKDVIRASWSLDSRMAAVLERAIAWIVPATPGSQPLSESDAGQVLSRARAARNVIWRLTARRFPKPAYRLRQVHHTGGATDEEIAETYSRPKDRYFLERKIEEVCNLPMGSIFVHCPRRKTSLKVAEVLVVGSDLSRAAQLRNLTRVSPEGLEPYEHEIVAVQDMYRSIWQFHGYLDFAFWDKQPIVEWAFERELKFLNDRLLSEELANENHGAYGLLAGSLRDEIPPVWLTSVIKRVDEEVPTRMRRGGEADLTSKLKTIIREVLAEVGGDSKAQLDLPGIDHTK